MTYNPKEKQAQVKAQKEAAKKASQTKVEENKQKPKDDK